MQQVMTRGLWESLMKLAEKKSPRLGAVAYVSDAGLVRFGKGDLLVVDASDAAIASGATSAAALRAMVRRGAEVVSLPGLHAKALALGDTAVIGSANISKSSMNSLIEASLVTTSHTILSGIKALVYQLARSGTPIDAGFLSRIGRIRVRQRVRLGGKGKPRMKLAPLGGATWIIGVREFAEDAFPKEHGVAQRGLHKARETRTYRNSQVEWVRFTGGNAFRTHAREGDLVIQICRPLERGPIQVFPHATVLLRQDEERTRTRFYLEARTGAAKRALPLRRFRALLKKQGFKGRIGQTSARQIDGLLSEAIRVDWH